jgi:hypothetical protein
VVVGYNRPGPEDRDELADWEEASLRHRMLDGCWHRDADTRLQTFFAAEVRKFLPASVVAFCPLRSFVQDTSTLYNGLVAAKHKGDTLTDARLGLMVLWAQQQQTLEFVRGLNDCYVRRSWDAEAQCVTYTVVPPSCAVGSPDPRNPSQPNRVRYLVERDDVVIQGQTVRWVWQDYDFRDPKAPVFRVITAGPESTGGGLDVTAQILAQDGQEVGTHPGNWQWWDRSGKPIWTWTAYHSQVGPHLRRAFLGHEVVDGTLIAACLWTYWLGGFRDAAWNLRWMLDCEVPAVAGTGTPQPYLAANPMAVMVAKSLSGKQGQLGAFPTPFDVEAASRSIGSFMAALGLFMGLSSADTSVTASGLSRVSGMAIEVSRDGKRKIEERMVLPMSISDCHNLAGAARLANAYADGPELSEFARDYSVTYASTPKSAEDIAAEVEAIESQVEAGLLDVRDAIVRMNPTLNREEAEKYAVDAAEFRARLAEIAARASVVQPADATNAEPDAAPVVAEDLAATALNGAQVTSALEIVQQVATGQLPRESAVSMLVEFFQLSNESANRVLGKVGAGFTPAAPEPTPPI